MLRGKHVNVVPFPFPLSPVPDYLWFHFLDLDVEGNALHPQLQRLREQLLRPLRPIEPHRLGARLQPERANQSDHAEEVVRVKMRKKNLGQRKAHPIARSEGHTSELQSRSDLVCRLLLEKQTPPG